MKKIAFVLTAILCSFTFLSCGEKESNAKQSNTKSEQVLKRFTSPAVAMYNTTPLYQEDDEGKMVYQAEADKGDIIELFTNENGEVTQKTAIRKLKNGKEEEFTFVNLSYDDTEYWTRDIFVSKEKTKPAVLMEECLVYTKPDAMNLTKEKLPENTFLALAEELGDFSKVYTYSGSRAFGRELYIESGNLYTGTDVIIIQTLNKLNKDTKIQIADEIVTNLFNSYFYDSYYQDIKTRNYFYEVVTSKDRSFPLSEDVIFLIEQSL